MKLGKWYKLLRPRKKQQQQKYTRSAQIIHYYYNKVGSEDRRGFDKHYFDSR